MKKKIFVTQPIPVSNELLKFSKRFEVEVNKKLGPLSTAVLKKRVRGAHAILSLLTDRIDGAIMDAAGKQLQIVANYAVGFDNVDLEAAKKRGIYVTNTPGPETSMAVAEHAMTLICALARKILPADKFARAEKYKFWRPDLFLGEGLRNRILGIVGLGRIGLELGEIAAGGFKMKILYSNPERRPDFEKKWKAKHVNLETLLGKSDFVSLHVPLLPSTRYLINTKELKMMKKTAFLVNTSRGPIVHEKALLKALGTGEIAGAGIDVFECEPAIDCDIRDDLEFKKMDNVILTPHIASATIEVRKAMARTAVSDITEALSGRKPRNAVV